MAKDKNKDKNTPSLEGSQLEPGPKSETVEFVIPDLLGLVDLYTYTNAMRIASTGNDVRIAVGDVNPVTGKTVGVVGIVMTHRHAKDFLRALKGIVDRLDDRRDKRGAGDTDTALGT